MDIESQAIQQKTAPNKRSGFFEISFWKNEVSTTKCAFVFKRSSSEVKFGTRYFFFRRVSWNARWISLRCSLVT